ncbi:hypothetical protein UO65_2292 [Actinokineospora spheciospongiae]|uniref:Uncharacterized protein n=1 Tax=Actinokineospora spheciospongiae TaxID=909613 RepID=W7IN55_9PSEU|nr:hypothetical protein [Actinokineospora spheciospongiae]EWC62305.1 hypothetical protein UO65_2292 [Actinokineospora spheciospongiae]PWW66873.1 hypothetical protein DFQ13_101391 [Actinokineospora spheciospongiae]
MNPRHQRLNPNLIVGRRARAVLGVVDTTGDLLALQFVFEDATSAVFTIWTDWTLVLDTRPDDGVPDYFWPPEDHAQRPLGIEIPPGGLEILSVAARTNDFGELAGADITAGDHLISLRTFAGDLALGIE